MPEHINKITLNIAKKILKTYPQEWSVEKGIFAERKSKAMMNVWEFGSDLIPAFQALGVRADRPCKRQ